MSDTHGHSGGSRTAANVAYLAYQLGRRFCRLPVFKVLIPGRFRSLVQRRMLSPAVLDRLPDRRYMEEIILPALAAMKPRRLLDVGVEAYTQHYGQWFAHDCEYWTLDFNPAVARFGSPGRHIVGDALELTSYFEPGSLDVVVMNGPFGFGIDRLDQQERSFEAVRTVLRPGGRLLVGWDRAADGTPFVGREPETGVLPIKDPLELEGIRAHFAHEPPDGLPARIEFADCSHIYDWFQAR